MGKSVLEKEFERLSKGAKTQSELDKAYLKALAAASKPPQPRSPAGKQYARRLGRIEGLSKYERESSIHEFERGMQEPNIPNLDRMSEDRLMQFWSKYHRPGKRSIEELFPAWPQRGLRRVVSDLANYASNKATEKASRRRKDYKAAAIYRKIADNIYADLPEYARFKG